MLCWRLSLGWRNLEVLHLAGIGIPVVSKALHNYVACPGMLLLLLSFSTKKTDPIMNSEVRVHHTSFLELWRSSSVRARGFLLPQIQKLYSVCWPFQMREKQPHQSSQPASEMHCHSVITHSVRVRMCNCHACHVVRNLVSCCSCVKTPRFLSVPVYEIHNFVILKDTMYIT